MSSIVIITSYLLYKKVLSLISIKYWYYNPTDTVRKAYKNK